MRYFISGVAWVFLTFVLLSGSAAERPVSAPEQVARYIYLSKRYPEAPPLSLLEKILTDRGVQGARLSDRDNNRVGRMMGHRFELEEAVLDADADLLAAAKQYFDRGEKLIIADLEADDLLAVAGLAEAADAIILNIRAGDDRLRVEDCHNNVFHIIPSHAMRADALAQYLVWKKWRRWFLVTGKQAADRKYAEAVQRAAHRFGGDIVETRSYRLETGARRVDTGHQQIQTQMPMLTRNAAEHDVVFVADEGESFGLYLPYRTAEPRPVVGSYGLVATAWHRSHEQYGSARLQRDFEKFAGRNVTEADYLAWLAVKLLGEAVMRGGSMDLRALRKYILSEELDLAGYKGRPLNFRRWNQQLRQPLLLSGPRSLVSIAPLEGFLHPHYYTDTLGFDRPDSTCRLSGSEA